MTTPSVTHFLEIVEIKYNIIKITTQCCRNKMSAEVSVKAALNKEPVVVRALIANNCSNTQISSRLAKKLGLNAVQDAIVTNSSFSIGNPVCLKWKVSLQPILITVKALKSHKTKVVFPIINCSEGDAFWEMIIGQDCSEQWEVLIACLQTADREEEPTPGPGWEANTDFMGHNMRLIAKSSDFRTPPNEFLEYLCFVSEAIKRIAINKVTGQLVAVFHDSPTVYMYDGVATVYADRIDAGESKGVVVSDVRRACRVSTIHSFPQTVLLTDGKF